MNLLLSGQPVRGRSCASCKLCCTLLPVELDDGWSRAGERCKHLCSKGCGIYERRPISCSRWSCRWLFDEDTAELRRPDQTHYVIDCMPDEIRMTHNETGERIMIGVLQVWVDPQHREAWRDPKLLAYIDAMGRKHWMATLIRWGSMEALTVFPPSISSDGEWHEIDGAMSMEIGNYHQHPEGRRPPI